MSNTYKTPLVDVLGGLLADKADAAAEADTVKAVLIGMAAQDGFKAFEGDLFRATVSFGNKKVVNYKGILESLVTAGFVTQAVMDDRIAAFTEIAEGVPTVKCSARKAA